MDEVGRGMLCLSHASAYTAIRDGLQRDAQSCDGKRNQGSSQRNVLAVRLHALTRVHDKRKRRVV